VFQILFLKYKSNQVKDTIFGLGYSKAIMRF